MKELTDEELAAASPEDWEIYRKAIEGLPTREGFRGNFLDRHGIEIPYGSGPHLLPVFRESLEIAKAKDVLEIGFNLGHGAAMWLSIGANVESIDISDKWETLYAALLLQTVHDGFYYWNRKQFRGHKSAFDLAFIDGGHDFDNVFADITLAKELNIPYLLFDDVYVRFGPGVLPAIDCFPELELVKDFNNLRLYKWR